MQSDNLDYLIQKIKANNNLLVQISNNQDYIKEQNNLIITKLKILEQILNKKTPENTEKENSYKEIKGLLQNIEHIISG